MRSEKILSLETIVIGSSLEAVAYAYINKLPLFYIEQNEPLGHKFIEQEFFDCYYNSNSLANYRELKNHFLFLLSMGGCLPFSGSIKSIRLADKTNIRVSTISFEKYTVNFKKVILFEPVILNGLDIIEREQLKNLVVDTFKIMDAAKNPFKYIYDNEDFVKEIYFYSTSQAVAFSYLDNQEVLDHDYSHFFFKRKVKWMMKENDIECSRKKAVINIIPRKRTIYQRFKEKYDLPNNIEINDQELKDICSPTNQILSKKLWELFPSTVQKEVSDYLGTTRLFQSVKNIPL